MFWCLSSCCSAVDIWNRIEPDWHVSRFAQPKHPLFAFLSLKKHACDEVHGDVMKCDRKTFNKWAWIFIQEIHDSNFEVASAFHLPTIISIRRMMQPTFCFLLILDSH
jgi:hypothetical protein